jgi:hypothetical protein
MTVVDRARSVLRQAIADVETAQERLALAKQTEQRGEDSCAARKQELAGFDDVELAIVNFRAEAFKSALSGAEASDASGPDLPDDLVLRRAKRDEARDQLEAAKAAHEDLVADVARAETALGEANEKVAVAAIGVLVAGAVQQADALSKMWQDLLQTYDRLRALADCRLQYGGGLHPIGLPANITAALKTLGQVQESGSSERAAQAGELWCRWFKALLADPNAAEPFQESLISSGSETAAAPDNRARIVA